MSAQTSLPIPPNAHFAFLHWLEPSGTLGDGLTYERYRHDTWYVVDAWGPRRVMRYSVSQSSVVDVNMEWPEALQAIAELGFGAWPSHMMPVPAPRGMDEQLPEGDWVRVPIAIQNLEKTTSYKWSAGLQIHGDLARSRVVPVSLRMWIDPEGVYRGHGTMSVSEEGLDVAMLLTDLTSASPLAGDLTFGSQQVPFVSEDGAFRVQVGISAEVVECVARWSLRRIIACDDRDAVSSAALTSILRHHWDLAAPIVARGAYTSLREARDLRQKVAAYLATVAATRRI